MASYYDAYTIHRDKVTRGTHREEDYPRHGSDITVWAVAIATLASLYFQRQQLRLQVQQLRVSRGEMDE